MSRVLVMTGNSSGIEYGTSFFESNQFAIYMLIEEIMM
jgi:hypothetical protein